MNFFYSVSSAWTATERISSLVSECFYTCLRLDIVNHCRQLLYCSNMFTMCYIIIVMNQVCNNSSSSNKNNRKKYLKMMSIQRVSTVLKGYWKKTKS